MPSLTQPYEAFEKPGLVVSYKVSNVKIYKGALVALNTSGYAVPITHGTASLKFIGVATETVDNSAGSAGDKSVIVAKSGSFLMKPAAGFSPVLVDLAKEVYAASDWEVQVSTTGLTNLYKVGTIVGVETTSTGVTGARIRIGTYVA
ncbi:MAG TPA: hypothetical protein VGE01_12445 [Fimbriimonas sp.]